MLTSVLGNLGERGRVGRTVAAAALTCASVLVFIGLGAAPAGAHHAVMTADSACVIAGTGKVQVTWTARSGGHGGRPVREQLDVDRLRRSADAGDGAVTFPDADADGAVNDYPISGTTSYTSTFLVDAAPGDTIHLVPRANVAWGSAQNRAAAGIYREYAASVQVPTTPCTPTGITVTFDCSSVSVTSPKDLSNIVLVFGDGRPSGSRACAARPERSPGPAPTPARRS